MTIRANRTVLIALLLLLVETAVFPWLVPPGWSDRLLPHLTFLVTVFVAVTAGRHLAFFFGLGFGLLQDVLFYGHLIGAYAFGMAFVGYLAGFAPGRRTPSPVQYVLLVALGGVMLDVIVYAIYRLFQLTDDSLAFAIVWQVVPTTIAQTFLAAVLYAPFRRWLVQAKRIMEPEEPDARSSGA
jgi:rod shape-determining protein MreD